MKKLKFIIPSLVFIASATLFQSCEKDDENFLQVSYPTAIVTVCPDAAGGFTMQLDNETTLYPSNVKRSPYGSKEVRALVNDTVDDSRPDGNGVYVNWLDSIRTKLPVVSIPGDNSQTFGNDPLEIIDDWVTVAEDGYLTLRFRTLWGNTNVPHHINLVTGINPDDPFEFELRHDATGDTYGRYSDALLAFNLNGLPRKDDKPVKVILHWNSFSGEKSAEFDLQLRPAVSENSVKGLQSADMIE